MNEDQYAVTALDELKNNALLLTVANDHLADEIFLIKIGNNISRSADLLKKDISFLKKKYPGRFASEVDTDSILQKIDNMARRMMKPGKELKDSHESGALGREMETYVRSIREAVDDIRVKVMGSHAAQVSSGSTTSIMEPIRNIFQSAGSLIVMVMKFLLGIAILATVAFAYLFVTMEKETPFLNEISSSRVLIKEKKGQVSKLEQERLGLYDKRQATKSDKDMTREEKVAALDLEMKIKKVNDNLDQLAAEILVQENKIKDNQVKLEEFQKKPFVSKLLKR